MIRYYQHIVMPTYFLPYPFTIDNEKWCAVINDQAVDKEALCRSLEQKDQVPTDNPDILEGIIKIIDVLTDRAIVHIGNDVVCRCGNIAQSHFTGKDFLNSPILAIYRRLYDDGLHIFTAKCRKCGTKDWRVTAQDHSLDYVIYSNERTIYITDGKYDA